MNPNWIYAIVEKGADTGRIAKMQVVWAADRRIQNGDIFENMAKIGTGPFDSERFLND